MLRALPVVQGDLTIREWTRQDVDLLVSWRAYPFPYEGFGFSFAQMDSAERDELFRARQEKPDTTERSSSSFWRWNSGARTAHIVPPRAPTANPTWDG
jgi:hypothetical protein